MSRACSALLLFLMLGACEPGPTEIVLVVDTDIPTADTIRITAARAGVPVGSSSANLGEQPPPRRLVLVHRGGELGPIHVTIEALEADGVIIAVERVLEFELHRSRTLEVFLANTCRGVRCPAGQSCGDRGTCRPIEVLACEYDDSCAPLDGGPNQRPDGDTSCPLSVGICGIALSHLPGDRVTPVPCTAAGATTGWVRGPLGDLPSLGGEPPSYQLDEVGTHRVHLESATDPTCTADAMLEVVTASSIADTGVSFAELRAIDARVGAAFVAGRGGAYAVDVFGWHDLRLVGTGDLAPADMRAVAVSGRDAIFGPSAADGSAYRIRAETPFLSAAITAVPLPIGSREVRDIALSLEVAMPMIVATKDGAVRIDGVESTPNAQPLGPLFDPGPSGWAALGAAEPATRGALFMGDGANVINVALTGGASFNAGAPAPIPAWLLVVRAAEVDDRNSARPLLWLCGAGGVGLWVLSGDWSAMSVFPEPVGMWTGNCLDLAVGPDGDAWVAAGTAGVVRLDRGGAPVLTLGEVHGVVAGASIDRIALTWDVSRREVWMLDAAARVVYSLSGDRPQ